MSQESTIARLVLHNWRLAGPLVLAPVHSHGFSGARLWQIRAGETTFCLRCWPEGLSAGRLQRIYRLLRAVTDAGIDYIPTALSTSGGDLVVHAENRLWTLETWLSGAPDGEFPSLARLTTAMQALARFHLAVAPHGNVLPSGEPMNAVAKRRSDVVELLGLLPRIEYAAIPEDWQQLGPVRERIIGLTRATGPVVLNEALPFAAARLPEQVCIRDVRSAHVLFTGDRVSGIVDFDAMQMTSVAVDVARLLGSYVADDYGRWQHGIDAYSAIRPLSPDERRAARVLDQLGVLGAGLSWLKWILLERRQFEVPQVLARLAVTERRLEHLSGRLRSSGGRIAVDL